ncbi:MAG: calcium-binding protein, partial [Pseudomonadota bacterium]
MTMNTLKKNRFALAALATILVATTGIASADARDRDRMGGQERFETMDADGNGQVTFAEFQARMLERFTEIDADND